MLRLRVMTWNIHSAVSLTLRKDLGAVAEEIAASGAEVVALQEIDRHWGHRSHGLDQPAWLAERLGMHWAFCPHIQRAPLPGHDQPRQFGLALLSRVPFERVTLHSLETTAHRLIPVRRPTLLEGVVRIDGHELSVFVMHFDVFSPAQRVREAREVTGVLDTVPRPLVFMGDLNSGPGAKPVGALRTGGLMDASVVAHQPLRSFPAHAPVLRLDHILVRGLAVRSVRVGDSLASDHRPLIADLGVVE